MSTNRNRWTRWALVAAILLGFTSEAHADWAWVRLIEGGLGIDGAVQVDSIEVFQSHLFVATHHGDGWLVRPRIFRASTASDLFWEEVTPSELREGEVTDMRVIGDQLFLGTSEGTLWKLDATFRWRELHPRLWTRTKPILALSHRPGSSSDPCVLREGIDLYCSDDPESDSSWTPVKVPTLLHDAALQSGRMHSLGSALYVGVGGRTAGDKTCQVWKYASIRSWFVTYSFWWPVTLDCFGDENLPWVVSMQEFEGWLYIGTGGHGTPGIFRTRGGAVEDVSPHSLYHHDPLVPGNYPVRFGSMTVADGRLFVGTRTPSVTSLDLDSARGADVIATAGGDTVRWERSNEPGFGTDGNDTTSALASDGTRVYAGTVNLDGFQVLRRTWLRWRLEPTPPCLFFCK